MSFSLKEIVQKQSDIINSKYSLLIYVEKQTAKLMQLPWPVLLDSWVKSNCFIN